MDTFDVLLTGGTVVDGIGGRPHRADLGIIGDRIRMIGTALPKTRAAQTLDCTGAVITPGFIDLHSHHDFTIHQSPGAQSCVMQGVTTLVTGNCGSSPFPVLGNRSNTLGSFPAQDGDLPVWPDFDTFADDVDDRRPAVNIAALVGHANLRTAVLGEEQRTPTNVELAAMCELLAQFALQGVFGFSTGLIYAPGSFADTEEILAVAREAARHQLLYATHMRDEGDGLLDAVDEAIITARASGVRLQISHLKAMGPANHGKVRQALAAIESAVADGVDVATDVYPYAASSTRLTSLLPDWALADGHRSLLERLGDPETRARIQAEMRDRVGSTESIVLAGMSPGPYTRWTGTSLAHIAEATGTNPTQIATDALIRHRGDVWVVNHAMTETDMEAVLRHPTASVISDGWVLDAATPGQPHPRHFGAFARVLRIYVRDRQMLTLPEAVRKMTSMPAARIGLIDRGALTVHAFADIAVFDPTNIADTATYEHPRSYAHGVQHVLVNGGLVVQAGKMTGRRPGRVLRKPATDSPPL